jgi:hypothetical protein
MGKFRTTFPKRPINHRFTKLAATTEVQHILANGPFLSQEEMLALLHFLQESTNPTIE